MLFRAWTRLLKNMTLLPACSQKCRLSDYSRNMTLEYWCKNMENTASFKPLTQVYNCTITWRYSRGKSVSHTGKRKSEANFLPPLQPGAHKAVSFYGVSRQWRQSHFACILKETDWLLRHSVSNIGVPLSRRGGEGWRRWWQVAEQTRDRGAQVKGANAAEVVSSDHAINRAYT